MAQSQAYSENQCSMKSNSYLYWNLSKPLYLFYIPYKFCFSHTAALTRPDQLSRGPDDKHFRHCGPNSFCHGHSFLLLSRKTATANMQMRSAAVFQQNFIIRGNRLDWTRVHSLLNPDRLIEYLQRQLCTPCMSFSFSPSLYPLASFSLCILSGMMSSPVL